MIFYFFFQISNSSIVLKGRCYIEFFLEKPDAVVLERNVTCYTHGLSPYAIPWQNEQDPLNQGFLWAVYWWWARGKGLFCQGLYIYPLFGRVNITFGRSTVVHSPNNVIFIWETWGCCGMQQTSLISIQPTVDVKLLTLGMMWRETLEESRDPRKINNTSQKPF